MGFASSVCRSEFPFLCGAVDRALVMPGITIGGHDTYLRGRDCTKPDLMPFLAFSDLCDPTLCAPTAFV